MFSHRSFFIISLKVFIGILYFAVRKTICLTYMGIYIYLYILITAEI